jgi:hypothetical protein
VGNLRVVVELETLRPCFEVELDGTVSGCDRSDSAAVETEVGFAAVVEASEGRKNRWNWLGNVEECVKFDLNASLDAGFVSFAWFIDLLEQFVRSVHRGLSYGVLYITMS